MKMSEKELSPSRKLAAKVVYEALKILKEKGGELPGRDVIEEVGKRVSFSDWENTRYEKTGYIRWQSILHFFTIDCQKAGYLIKKNGVWYLTPEGEEAIGKYDEVQLLESARQAYVKWKGEQPESVEQVEEGAESGACNTTKERDIAIDKMEQLALESIESAINEKGPYEFQDLVAALLHGMNYYTPFIAPKGKDGGIDIVAYRDPLGTTMPRIKVQVKHRQNTASVKEVRELIGVLSKDGDSGLFVSTGGFAPDAKAAANSSHSHIELVDLNRFITLWTEFYNKMSDDDKSLLPLRPVYFIAPTAS